MKRFSRRTFFDYSLNGRGTIAESLSATRVIRRRQTQVIQQPDGVIYTFAISGIRPRGTTAMVVDAAKKDCQV